MLEMNFFLFRNKVVKIHITDACDISLFYRSSAEVLCFYFESFVSVPGSSYKAALKIKQISDKRALSFPWDAFRAGLPQLIPSSPRSVGMDLRLVLHRPGVVPCPLQLTVKRQSRSCLLITKLPFDHHLFLLDKGKSPPRQAEAEFSTCINKRL
jgi:hypothetical protein